MGILYCDERQSRRARATGPVRGCIRICDVGKSKTPARGILRAQFFDDELMSQEGQICQQALSGGFNVFAKSWSCVLRRWLRVDSKLASAMPQVDFTVFVKNPP
jgi:hypothetical protein